MASPQADGFPKPAPQVNAGISPTSVFWLIMGTEQEETYRLLMQGDGFRIGLVVGHSIAAPPSATIEFLVRLFPTGDRLNPHEMERATELVRRLTRMGYQVYFQEDGWVSCEKPIGEAQADAETRFLQDLLMGELSK